MPWKKLLAWATGQIDDVLRQKLEFVLEEDRVYRALLDRHSPQWRLQDAERKVLAEKGKTLGKLLGEVITIVQPETLLQWHRKWVASKWDFASRRKAKLGRPSVSVKIEPRIRSWRVSFHAVAVPICGGIGTTSGWDFNCGAVAANQAQTRS